MSKANTGTWRTVQATRSPGPQTAPGTITPLIPGKLSLSGRVDAQAIAEAGVTLVLDLAQPHEPQLAADLSVPVLRVPLVDGPLPSERTVATLVAVVQRHIDRHEHVLVACVLGQNRSALVAALALCACEHLNGAAALARVRAARGPASLHNAAFARFVQAQAIGGLARAAAPAALLVWPARHIGEQLHVHRQCPTPTDFEPPRNRARWALSFAANQPNGGFYTACLRETPAGVTSSFIEVFQQTRPELLSDRDAYRLLPEPDAQLVVIDDPATAAAALRRFGVAHSQTFDFEAMLAAGVAGLHLTALGAASCPELGAYSHEQTLWLRWAFVGAAQAAGPHVGRRAAAARERLLAELDRRFPPPLLPVACMGRYAGRYVVVQPRREVQNAATVLWHWWAKGSTIHHPPAVPVTSEQLQAAILLFIDRGITDHNLLDATGQPLPVGPGLLWRLLAEPDDGRGLIAAILTACHVTDAFARLQHGPYVAGGAP